MLQVSPAAIVSAQPNPGVIPDSDASEGAPAGIGDENTTLRWRGGSGTEWIEDFVVLPDGDVVVVGYTQSPDLPGRERGFDDDYGAEGPGSAEGDYSDGFVARLAADGSGARWASYVGGNAPDYTHAVALLPDGDLVLVGTTRSDDFPLTKGALDHTCDRAGCEKEGGDAYVLRVSPEGALRWSTLLGGEAPDAAKDVVVDPNDSSLWVVGGTASPDFPVTDGGSGPHSSTGPSNTCGIAARMSIPCEDLFVAHMSPDGQRLTFATVHGGSERDMATTAALAPDGDLVVGGFTESEDISVTHSPQGRAPQSGPCNYMWGCDDGLLLRVSRDHHVRFVAVIGGEGVDSVSGLAVDAAGDVIFAGSTSSQDLRWRRQPLGSVAERLNSTEFSMAGVDRVGYVARMAGDASQLTDLALLGGPHDRFDLESIDSLALAEDGTIYVGAEANRLEGVLLGLHPEHLTIQWGRRLGFESFQDPLVHVDEEGRARVAGTAAGEDSDATVLSFQPVPIGVFGRLFDEQREGLPDAHVTLAPIDDPTATRFRSQASGVLGDWAIEGLGEETWIARPEGHGLWAPPSRLVSPSTRLGLDFRRTPGVASITPARLDALAPGDTITLSLRVGHPLSTTLAVTAPWPAGTELVPDSVRGGRDVVVEAHLSQLSAVIDLDDRGQGELHFAVRLDKAGEAAARLGFTPCVEAPLAPCVPVETARVRRHAVYLPHMIVGSRDGISDSP